jgi:hypothetical protein
VGDHDNRIKQTERGLHMRAALRPTPRATPPPPRFEHGLRATLAGLGVEPLEIAVEPVDRIDGGRDAAGKFKLVEAHARPVQPAVSQEHR